MDQTRNKINFLDHRHESKPIWTKLASCNITYKPLLQFCHIYLKMFFNQI